MAHLKARCLMRPSLDFGTDFALDGTIDMRRAIGGYPPGRISISSPRPSQDQCGRKGEHAGAAAGRTM